MAWWWLWLGAAAWSGPLQEATAWAHLQAGDAPRARQVAAEALGDAPTERAAALYLEALAAEGLVLRGLAELDGRALKADEAADAVEALATLLAAGDEREAVAAARRLAKEHPDRPEWLAPLWSVPSTPALERARRRLGTAPAYSAPLEDLRWYQLDQLAGRETPEARLEVVAEHARPMAPPLDDVGRHEAARTVFAGGAVPEGAARRVQADIVRRAHAMFLDAGRPLDALAAWQGLTVPEHGLIAVWGRAEAEVLGGQPLDVDALRHLLGRAVPGDRAVADVERLRHDAGAWSLVHAQGWAATHPAQAWAAWALTTSLGVTAPEALGRQLDRGRVGHATVAPPEALQAVREADSTHALYDAVWGALGAAAAGVTKPSEVTSRPDLWREAWVPVLDEAVARAEVLEAPEAVAAWGALRLAAAGRVGRHAPAVGAAHRALTQHDAAFHWLAIARAEGADVDEALVALYDGPGDAGAVADAIAGPAGSRPDPRAEATAPTGPATPEVASSPTGWGPELGARPSLSFSSDAGRIGDAQLRGRTVLLTFWASDCEPCLAQLPEIAREVRALRRSFRDVVVLAVSTDDDPAAFADVARVADRWALLYRDPGLADRLGIRRVPTTVVIGPEGRVGAVVPHRLTPEKLRDLLMTDFD